MSTDAPAGASATRPAFDGPRPPVPLRRSRRMRSARLSLPALERAGTPDYYLLGAVTVFLSVFGLVMVLSASSVEQSQDGGDPFSDFTRQGIALFLGLAVMMLASRAAPEFWRRLAPIALVLSVGVQLLTAATPLGTKAGGNQNWLTFGPVSLQPSEFVKFALILVVASFFTRRPAGRTSLRALLPILLLGGLAIGSVMLGGDMGTCVIMALILISGLFFADVRTSVLLTIFGLVALLAVVFVAVRGSRIERFSAWAHGCSGQMLDTCWQNVQGTWALAAGGIFGVGIGNSVSKWSWLPEADNDFILAIIGEETGLIGLCVLLLLFVLLTVAFLRVTTRSRDTFTRVAAGMMLAWIVGQAFVNMAVVLGLLPVLGVPLPFISLGGSSMVANLLAVGCLMSLANARPPQPADAARLDAMRAHPSNAFRQTVPPLRVE